MNINIQQKMITLPETPKKIKKITGTRFAAILGLNPWATPFETWCDMTGAYKIPFEDNQYTLAGKIIEPKVIAYLDRKYYYGRHMLKGADEWFGKTKEQLHFDHFPEETLFGGMWDARTSTAVYELKTSKRVEDWYKNGVFSAPEYYKLQGALYAYLMGLDDFRLVLTILEDKDYADPESFVPTPKNTLTKSYSLRTEYPNFEDKINYCLEWYERHVVNPVSPGWDEKKDAEIIKALTTARITPSDNGEQKDIIAALLSEIEPIQAKIDLALLEITEDEKALKKLKDQLKPELQGRMKDSDKKIVLPGKLYSFEVAKTAASGIDIDKIKADGLYEKYRKIGYTYKLNINPIKEEIS